jgi:hypothetical protein
MTAPIASGWSEVPGVTCTYWKAPPFHGARQKQTYRRRDWNEQPWTAIKSAGQRVKGGAREKMSRSHVGC